MAINFEVLLPAFLAGLLVISTHVPLGREVLKRGIIFIDLAIAQIAVLGVVAAKTLDAGESGVLVQVVAFASAVAGSALLQACERRWPHLQEAIIGSAFVVAAAATLLLIAGNPHGGDELQGLLAGQILWVTWQQLAYITMLYAIVLVVWARFPFVRGKKFYLLFAITVTASVQMVGVLLVFASLVIPALLVQNVKGSSAWWWAYAHAVLAFALGFLLSVVFDLPTGPMVVCMLAFVGVGLKYLVKPGE